MSRQGTPIWYELATSDPDAAQRFYTKVLGWSVADSGMTGMDYRIARAGDEMVAGLTAPPMADTSPRWSIYFAVKDCDAKVKAMSASGAKVLVPPTDIPNVGRFAVLTDPQGATFCLLRGTGGDSTAFDQKKTGHGNWHELMSSDPKAALAFYRKHFGWKASTAMDMGPMGTYQLFSHQGQDIGGMMGLGNAPMPCWLPYFGVTGVDAAITRITGAGGTTVHGPMAVPNDAFIVVAQDPQGAYFALVGPK